MKTGRFLYNSDIMISMLPKECDHKSVGMLVWRDGCLLLIERRLPPFGFSPPAGHVDEDRSFEEAAKRELREEVGLEARNLKLVIERRIDNHCRRNNGSWHYWKIYEVDAGGEIERSKVETKQARFVAKDDLSLLTKRTEEYIRGEWSEREWEKKPGLEPVWYDWMKTLKIL